MKPSAAFFEKKAAKKLLIPFGLRGFNQRRTNGVKNFFAALGVSMTERSEF
jgi:hypothetical protein